MDKISHFLKSGLLGSGDICPVPDRAAENGLVIDLEGLEAADAFRNGKNKLGRRSGQVYKLLFGELLGDSEIAARTGASLKTIRRVLRKLAAVRDYKTGEIIQMISRDETGKWRSNVVDLDLIESIVGTRGKRQKERDDYARERRDHARSLERGSMKTKSG